MKSFTTAAIAALAASVSATSPPAYAVSQIADGQIQAPTGNPVTQIADGQIQAPTGSPVTQIADGQIQAPTGSPVTQIADGQIQAPTGAPVQQIGDGQIQQPKASGVQQIADGQIQQPAAGGVPTYSGSKTCQNITVPVSITARNAVFDQMKLTPKDNIDVTNFILNNARQGHNFTQESIMGYTDFSGDYNLSTTYCAPSGGAPSTVQLLTHGIGFDRSYWDFSYNNYNYSYTSEAVEKYGYATFSHDRLGIGMSSHGEPVNEIQVALEIAALKELTDKLRAGEIAGVPAFKKVIHVGHSFGSVQSYALAAMYPDITDGLGLTGFSQNGTFLPFFQYGGDFTQANLNPAFTGKYVDGYLAPASASAVQTNFFAEGDFDPKVLEVATMTGQPVTIGELLTIGGATGSKNPTKAPVLIITGEKDLPFCGGDCFAAPTGFQSIPETSKAMFPNTANFVVDIVPGAGHGLNLQYTHVQTYASIFGFFQSNGLAA